MVRAILEGRKTQTRRIVKPQPERCSGCQSCNYIGDHFTQPLPKCPYGAAETKLWVREAWAQTLSGDYIYKANYCEEHPPMGLRGNWKPSIHMPKEAARIFLEISEIRVERLHDISECDSLAEGIDYKDYGDYQRYFDYQNHLFSFASLIWSFRSLWKSINGEESWDSNPWVWVVSFEKKWLISS